jgi:acyl-CoA thioester hydrolase
MTNQSTSGEISVRIRYAECDPMGILHHAKYLEFFEMGRVELLRQSGFSYRTLEEQGVFFVVFKVNVKYHAPSRFDDELRVETSIERMTRARIDHNYRVMRDGKLVCEGTSTLACVDGNGKIIPIPDEIFVPIPS